MNPAEHLATATAHNHVRKTVGATEGPVLTIRAGVDDAALDEFLLHLHEYFTRDDSLMAVFHIILRYNAVVLYSSLCKEVGGVGFLQQGITDVFFIPQNLIDITGMPFFISGTIKNAVRFEAALDFQHASTFEVFPVV